jgi:YHS domain-containing protein
MVRAVLYLFLAIILISLLRSVIGVLGKLFGSLTDASAPARSGEPKRAGDLKRDPVCGTYVSSAASVKRTVNGQILHFCSEACSRKHQKS